MARDADVSGFRFPKSRVLRKSEDIDRAFKSGKKYSCRGMRIHVLASSEPCCRAAFVSVRAYGDSVRRHRAKRVAREGYRQLRQAFSGSYDIVFVLFPGPDSFTDRTAQTIKLLMDAKILSMP